MWPSFGAMKDKDVRGMLAYPRKRGRGGHRCAAADVHGRQRCAIILRDGKALGITVVPGGSVKQGLQMARRIAGRATHEPEAAYPYHRVALSSQVKPCLRLRKPLDIFLEMTYIPQGFLNRFDSLFSTRISQSHVQPISRS